MTARNLTARLGPVAALIADLQLASSAPVVPNSDALVTAATPPEQIVSMIDDAQNQCRIAFGPDVDDIDAEYAAAEAFRIIDALVSGQSCGYTLSKRERSEGIRTARVYGIARNTFLDVTGIVTPIDMFGRVSQLILWVALLVATTAAFNDLGWSSVRRHGGVSADAFGSSFFAVLQENHVVVVGVGVGCLALSGALAIATVRARPTVVRIVDRSLRVLAGLAVATVIGLVVVHMWPDLLSASDLSNVLEQ
ncbi:hypothetical protein [Rhodococcoides fascians]|uniref:hypothetical protein n=1 Tax=Rhodococcoides fascians TaxID=1828 RepID=UPI00050BDDF1|nr:hypothetical protein [Rhodococcus fascians]